MKGLRRMICMLLCSTVGLLLTGCANMTMTAPFTPPKGFIVTSVSAPLQVNYPKDGIAVTNAKGSATSLYIHDILLTGMNVGWDDCSIEKAARNGNIRKVHYADYSLFTVLGIFGKTTITVYGDR